MTTAVSPRDTERRRVQSSELSRNPAGVFAAAEHGPVTITRRDGEDFVLTRAQDAEKQRRGVEAGLRVASSLVLSGPDLALRLREPFPWIEFLSESDRLRLASEIVEVARACAAVANFDPLLIALAGWKSTAVAIAAGYPRDEDLEWFDEGPTVADPRQE